MKIIFILSTALIIIITILDYFNLPMLLGINIANINFDFYMAFLNILSITVMYIITYYQLDKKTAQKEKNKENISLFLIKYCYEECLQYIQLLNDQTVEKHIIPKIDFNSPTPKLIDNLQTAPFHNENIIMDLLKDGQISSLQTRNYFHIKAQYQQYITMRILTFDAPHIYLPLKATLLNSLNQEISNINKHISQ